MYSVSYEIIRISGIRTPCIQLLIIRNSDGLIHDCTRKDMYGPLVMYIRICEHDKYGVQIARAYLGRSADFETAKLLSYGGLCVRMLNTTE